MVEQYAIHGNPDSTGMADGKAEDRKIVDQTPNGYIAQWLERLTADQQVPGSNPGVPFALSDMMAIILDMR